MGMGIGLGVKNGSSPPPSSSRTTNPKKKRRTNNMKAQATQRTSTIKNFVPPPLSEFRDTVVASNIAIFDNTLQLAMNSCMQNGPQQIHPHHRNNLENPQMREMNPLAGSNMNPMIFHVSNANSMNSLTMDNQMGHMENLLSTNHSSINNMNPMNNMRPNIPQESMGPMNINHMINSQMGGSRINCPINGFNHDLGSPMGSPINNMSPNHIPSNTLNVPAINAANTAMSYNALQPHTDHSNNIYTRLNIPYYSTVVDAIPDITEINNLDMIKPQMPNIPNVNSIRQSNHMGHIGNPMEILSEKSSIHGMNVANLMPQYGLQEPPALEPKQIPKSSGKVYPPNQYIIFDDQNPSAPAISPCGICHTEVHDDDQAVLCQSGCKFWFHRRCVG